MPGRLVERSADGMASSAEDDAAVTVSTATRRKSGRVVHKPEFYGASSPAASVAPTKRKRAAEDDEEEEEQGPAAAEDEENDVDMDASEDDVEESEGEADEEERKEQRRKARNNRAKAKPTQKKSAPPPKKSRTNANGEGVSLAIRAAATQKKKKRPVKAKPIADAAEEGGLYAEIFSGENSVDKVAEHWVEQFKENESQAVTDIVNFVLKCAGCDIKVDVHDIEDPDSCTSKLGDIQDEYQAQNITDYPLISKGKGATSFKKSIVDFFDSLTTIIAQTNLLYENIDLMENIEVWISTMSSAGNRPFRHTATIVSLAIISALCDIGRSLVEESSKNLRLVESEKKKARPNKSRIAEFDAMSKDYENKREQLDNIIKDWFDTVFVHRYRDVDPKIRVDCVQALADWIMTYPDLFFDGRHLRYLGWVLSDSSAPTRLEVVKQMQRLYKDQNKIGGLKTFTERFRPRMVEMATRDAEANVRAASVELLDILREAGLLEPDDIDSVGRLIFDSEPRVRKAVVGFFAENINDMYDSKVEELGGKETIEEAFLADEEDEDYDHPRIEWLKLKCLVEALEGYDSQDMDLPSQIERGPNGSSYTLVAAGVESRFSLAAQVLYDHIDEIREWEILGGYLLYDHSSTATAQNGTANTVQAQFKDACTLSEKEEIILLEILNAAVKIRLAYAVEQGTSKSHKKSKKEKEQLLEEQEAAARHLAGLIPRLLSKFGATPEAAAAVLRLEHVLNLDVFQELRQDSAGFAALLDDINRQFLTHAHAAVLVEASAALRHAQAHDELAEVTAPKVQALWDETTASLHALARQRDLATRGSLSAPVLTALASAVMRVAALAGIADPREPLESVPTAHPPPSAAKKGKGRGGAGANSTTEAPPTEAVTHLLDLVRRGIPTPDLVPETEALEDEVVVQAARALLFYFMWTVRAWRDDLEAGRPIGPSAAAAVAACVERRDAFVRNLVAVVEARRGADAVRVGLAGVVVDVHVLFAGLRGVREGAAAEGAQPENADEEEDDDWRALIRDVDPSVQKLLARCFEAAERTYARKARKHVEVGDEDEPVDSDEEPEEDEEDEEGGASEVEETSERSEAHAERQTQVLLAEQRLCELAGKLVLGVLAGVLDSDGEGRLRRRLERNKTRLGANFKEVVAHLEGGGADAATAAKRTRDRRAAGEKMQNQQREQRPSKQQQQKSHKSVELIESSEDEEEDDDDEGSGTDDGEDEEALRRRGLLEERSDEQQHDDDATSNAEQRNGDPEEEEESVIGD